MLLKTESSLQPLDATRERTRAREHIRTSLCVYGGVSVVNTVTQNGQRALRTHSKRVNTPLKDR